MSNTVKLPTCPKCGAPIPIEAPQGLCPKCVLLGAATATETGTPATATSEIPSIERIASAFPQLEVLELIGRGGMGFVFKARQPHLDRFVALKLLPDKLAKDPQFAERFNREGRVLAKLNHPNIVSVFDFGQTGGFYYLLMEYVDGVNLRQAMRAGRFSPGEALAIVPKICEALQYAHEQGVLHRDIKPENILLDAKGRVKIADFGIAKLVGEDQSNITLTNAGSALGTPHYMAPEQLEKPSTVDHRADIYSLGVVFYEMLTGELPIGRFAAPSSKTPVNTTVDDVVFRTLEKDRERRFQSAGEMKTQVEHLGEGANATAQANTPRTEPEERSYSRWSIYGALSVGLSLPVPFATIVALISGRGGIGPAELWLALGSVALPGLGGTLLGWLGLNEIRDSGGRVRGLPLALFATLFWPLTIFVALTVGIPMFWAVPGGEPGVTHTIGRILMLLLPAAVIAFSFWTIHATARWANRQSIGQRHGVLKWIFIGVLVIGMGMVMITNPLRPKPAMVSQTIQSASSGNASEETWAPELAAGEKPDVSGILQEAKRLTDTGRYEDALQRQIWYHNHALEHEPAQSAVRLSFALSHWMELARRYPKAREALLEIRDRAMDKFNHGGGYFESFQEVAAINRERNQEDATVALFKSIDAGDPNLAKQCYHATKDLLVERGEYALCARYIEDFQQHFTHSKDLRERLISTLDRTPEVNRSQLRKEGDRSFIKDTRSLIEILVGVGRKSEAETIQSQALAVLNVTELKTAIADAEARANRLKELKALVASAAPANTRINRYSFGPVITRTLSFDESMQARFLNLDTGELLSPPNNIAEFFKQQLPLRSNRRNDGDTRAPLAEGWLISSGANLMASGEESAERLEIFELAALAPTVISNDFVVPFGFDEADPDYLGTRISKMLQIRQWNRIRTIEPGFTARLNRRQDSFCFKTRYGTIGILQIVSLATNPPGVQIRYKHLLENPATSP